MLWPTLSATHCVKIGRLASDCQVSKLSIADSLKRSTSSDVIENPNLERWSVSHFEENVLSRLTPIPNIIGAMMDLGREA